MGLNFQGSFKAAGRNFGGFSEGVGEMILAQQSKMGEMTV